VTISRLEAALWTSALIACVGATVAWRRALSPAGALASSAVSVPSDVRTFDSESLHAAVEAVVESNPFRLDRRPAQVAYDPELEGAAPAPPPPPPVPKPSLSLAGIVGGPPWEALVDGIPGREGSALVRGGQVVGELRVRSVDARKVVIEGADTVWTLTLRKPWQ